MRAHAHVPWGPPRLQSRSGVVLPPCAARALPRRIRPKSDFPIAVCRFVYTLVTTIASPVGFINLRIDRLFVPGFDTTTNAWLSAARAALLLAFFA